MKDGPFDAVMLQEEIAKGQRVERFRIEISDDGRTWETAAEGTTIGYKRIVRLPEARTARKLRVTIDGNPRPGPDFACRTLPDRIAAQERTARRTFFRSA